jgi:predicted hydrocarbon binding protein
MSKAPVRQGPPIPHMTIDEKGGTINAFGERFLFIPINLIHSMEDRLTETLGPVTATGFEYEIGKQGGANFIRIAKHAGLGTKSPAEIQRIADSLGTMSGWGKLDIVSFDFGKKLARIRWTNGVSVRNRTGKTAVCHFGRGILTGAVAEILGAKCESIEVTCQGKGDKVCEAVIGEPREINRIAATKPR